jgi:hypothetical protein
LALLLADPLEPVYDIGSCFQLGPAAAISNPRRWLRDGSHFQGTSAWLPWQEGLARSVPSVSQRVTDWRLRMTKTGTFLPRRCPAGPPSPLSSTVFFRRGRCPAATF